MRLKGMALEGRIFICLPQRPKGAIQGKVDLAENACVFRQRRMRSVLFMERNSLREGDTSSVICYANATSHGPTNARAPLRALDAPQGEGFWGTTSSVTASPCHLPISCAVRGALAPSRCVRDTGFSCAVRGALAPSRCVRESGRRGRLGEDVAAPLPHARGRMTPARQKISAVSCTSAEILAFAGAVPSHRPARRRRHADPVTGPTKNLCRFLYIGRDSCVCGGCPTHHPSTSAAS